MSNLDVRRVGTALAAPGRARMIDGLLDGQEHTSGELARRAGLASGTASEHLALLADAGLVTVRRDGRHRRARVADATIASALEVLSRDRTLPDVTSYQLSAEQRRLRSARTCYDHLAGLLGVAVHAALTSRWWLDESGTALTDAGRDGLSAWDLDMATVERQRRPTVLVCVDWTERRPHLAGGLGAAIADLTFTHGWVRRLTGGRGLRITPEGRRAFVDRLGLPDDDWLAG
jgi:DNA-binding transcriptional ArsR family regulator